MTDNHLPDFLPQTAIPIAKLFGLLLQHLGISLAHVLSFLRTAQVPQRVNTKRVTDW
jgi:hypothetical protein